MTDPNDRIVNGVKVAISDHPYQVGLQVTIGGYKYICGGVLIRPRWVLSAAHCVDPDTDSSDIRLSFGKTKYSAGDWSNAPTPALHYRHREFNKPLRHQNDMLLIKLKKPATDYWVGAKPAELDSGLALGGSSGKKLVVSGWGNICDGCNHSDHLLKALINYVAPSRCKTAYGPNTITSDMLCAGYNDLEVRDSCQGDSGGPLVARGAKDVVVGIVSWGIGCARPKLYGVYARVKSHRAWIEKKILLDSAVLGLNPTRFATLSGLALKVKTLENLAKCNQPICGSGPGTPVTDPSTDMPFEIARYLKSMPNELHFLIGSNNTQFLNVVKTGQVGMLAEKIRTGGSKFLFSKMPELRAVVRSATARKNFSR